MLKFKVMMNKTLILLGLACLVLLKYSNSQQVDGIPDVLPDNMYADTLFAPFNHGVASFDPTAASVIIWTKLTPTFPNQPQDVMYQVSTTADFTSIVAQGSLTADSSKHYTVAVEVNGLNPHTDYYYRFSDGELNYSRVGATRTAPINSDNSLHIAVVSCSSVFSGYFNAYRHLANDASIDAVLHLGDYIYDFVDGNERVRVPQPEPQNQTNREDWRQLHAYHLLDPDLRLARASKPFVLLWDNHDIGSNANNPQSFPLEAMEAFREYCPSRRIDDSPEKLYRKLSYGELLDIFVVDARLLRRLDTLPSGQNYMTGLEQWNWLKSGLLGSTAKWKIITSQEMVGGWSTSGVPSTFLPLIPNSGDVFDGGSWDGFPEFRNEVFDFLSNNQLNNVIFVSGDAHVSMGMDLTKEPKNPSVYNPETGEGSVGVEFLPTSISRGNLDEGGVPAFLVDLFEGFDKTGNPQHVYAEFTKHGYGLLSLNSDSVTATFRYFDKLTVSNVIESGKVMTLLPNQNHWKRDGDVNSFYYNKPNPAWSLIENPVNPALALFTVPTIISVYNLNGQVIIPSKRTHVLDISALKPSVYLVKNEETGATIRLVKN